MSRKVPPALRVGTARRPHPFQIEVEGGRAHPRRMNSRADIDQRHEAIRRTVTPLPGSLPRDHFKPLNIPGDCDGLTLLAALERLVGNVSSAEWLAEFALGRIVDLDQRPTEATQVVRAGQRYRHLFTDVTEPEVNGCVEILHEGEALIVVNKRARFEYFIEDGNLFQVPLLFFLIQIIDVYFFDCVIVIHI